MPSARDFGAPIDSDLRLPSGLQSLEDRLLLSGDPLDLNLAKDDAEALSSFIDDYVQSPVGLADAAMQEVINERLKLQSYVPGELVVASLGDDAAQTLRDLNLTLGLIEDQQEMFTLQTDQGPLTLTLVNLGANADLSTAANTFAGGAGIVWASPNFIHAGEDPREFTPNDPDYTNQYHHTLIDNDLAWDITLGDSSIIIGVTDDGVDINHPDLAANIWTNPGEIAGNGIDDDGNGYIDDVTGYDFADNDANVVGGSGDDHGTHVAGIAAGVTNNGVGISGTAGGSTIMPLRFYNGGSWTATMISDAFTYATDNGANIINTSYNMDGWAADAVVTAAYQYLYDGDVLHFNSAGNGSSAEPARQIFHQTFLVASTTSSDGASSFTNYGTGIDIASPGSDILSTTPNNTYASFSGTSMAAPNAAGVAALIWSANPDWTRDQVVAQMFASAENIDAQNADKTGLLGGGRVNSYDALTQVIAAPQIDSVTDLDGEDGLPSSFKVAFDQVMDPATINGATGFELVGLGPDELLGTADDTSHTIELATTYLIGTNDLQFNITSGALPQGQYKLTIEPTVANPFGQGLDGNGDGIAGDAYDDVFAVVPPAEITSFATLPSALVNDPYSFTFDATGGLQPYEWAVVADYVESAATGSAGAGAGVAQGWNADDSAWSYTLPFDFPYYGVDYAAVNVSSNGFLDFGISSSAYQNSAEDLGENIRIAPLWDDLRTDEAGDDIYIDESVAGQVTIRWDAARYSTLEPMDFSVTLSDDGGIRFDYAIEHTGITPTIGVAGGTGAVLSTLDASTVVAGGTATTFGEGGLPEGLTFDTTTGVLSGTPTQVGTYGFGVVLTDNQPDPSTDAIPVTLSVLATAPVDLTSPSNLPDASIDSPYSYQLGAVDGFAPYTFELLGGEYVETTSTDGDPGDGGVPQGWNADDDNWSYTLPFDFPFYGSAYGSVNVSSNGFIDFAVAESDHTNTEAELIENVRIAPMWDDLRTDQTGNDIFIDESVAGQITIRWDAARYSTLEPMDFAVTLGQNGDIRFDYGSAHSGISPTMGISSGTGTYTLSTRNNDTTIDPNVASQFDTLGLPAGLELDESTGIISGTPTELGVYEFGVIVFDDQMPASVDTAVYTLEVIEGTGSIPGDANGDGIVNLLDLNILGQNWQTSGAAVANGDFNGDGDVNLLDLDILGQNWDTGTASAAVIAAPTQSAKVVNTRPSGASNAGFTFGSAADLADDTNTSLTSGRVVQASGRIR